MTGRELVVDINATVPKNYGFLKKGNPFRSGLCRRLTLAAGQTLYVVTQNKVQVGLRAPKSILAEVFKQDNATKDKRRAAVAKRDGAARNEFTSTIHRLFPNIPEKDMDAVLARALKKRSGRVGRTGKLDVESKARLAVIAHVRHNHTSYETLLKHNNVPKREAREDVFDDLVRVLQEWAGGLEHARAMAKSWRIGFNHPTTTGTTKEKSTTSETAVKPESKSPSRRKKRKTQREGQRRATKAPRRTRSSTRAQGQQPEVGVLETFSNGRGRSIATCPSGEECDQRVSGREPSQIALRTRSAMRGQDKKADAEELEVFFNDEDEPIVISSSGSDTDDAGEPRRQFELDVEALDYYSDEFIVHDSDDDWDQDFSMD